MFDITGNSLSIVINKDLEWLEIKVETVGAGQPELTASLYGCYSGNLYL